MNILALVKKLSEDKSETVRLTIVEHKNCPIHILEKLASDKKDRIRVAVAKHDKCPVHILEQLSKDVSPDVRIAVAEHKNCPSSICWHLLIELANNEKDMIRIAVASHDKCQIHILEKLAKDKDEDVRLAVVEHPNCPEHVLEELFNDEHGWVSWGVLKHHNCPKHIFKKISQAKESDDVNEKCDIATNDACPIDLLGKLSQDGFNWQVRAAVANNPNCTSQILATLAEDEEKYVRCHVARNLLKKNPKLSIFLVEAGFYDWDCYEFCVVYASNAQEAKEIVRTYVAEEHKNGHVDEDNFKDECSVKELNGSAEPKIIISAYRSG